ncbi:hypothetical protein AVEN_214342-1 [Araneus ventricosus]|uniref:Uncharacterized protein n=1 Tax=Araneus ventricosus TaxID=182803 RepID=A0A4Y2HZQ5_ARAVE|nr:hypothetical protein AVEN_214342-1 [Araneus ventricosus]
MPNAYSYPTWWARVRPGEVRPHVPPGNDETQGAPQVAQPTDEAESGIEWARPKTADGDASEIPLPENCQRPAHLRSKVLRHLHQKFCYGNRHFGWSQDWNQSNQYYSEYRFIRDVLNFALNIIFPINTLVETCCYCVLPNQSIALLYVVAKVLLWVAQLTSFLARTAGRIPKAFALQGDPSRSRHPPPSKRSPYIVFPAGRDVTWNDLAHSWRIFSPNRDIEKIPAPLRSHISSPSQGTRRGCASHPILIPVKLSSQP